MKYPNVQQLSWAWAPWVTHHIVSYKPNWMILVIYNWISVWIIGTTQATEKYSAAMYYSSPYRVFANFDELKY